MIRIIGAVMDTLLPQGCIVCGSFAATTAGAPLCRQCRRQLRPIGRQCCDRCGGELISEESRCNHCQDREYDFIRNIAVFDYLGAGHTLLAAYKFANRREIASLFALHVHKIWRREFAETILVPVPGNPKNVRKRGWDQMAVLADLINRRHGVPTVNALIRRRGGSQKQLNRQQRLEHARNLYHVAEKTKKCLRGSAVTLLDDVFTTGATLNACANLLKKAGVERVYAVTLTIRL